MYAGENKASNSAANDGPDMSANSESGPALEVVELANGETIWCDLSSFFSCIW